jgi:hypothetical protein
MKCAIIKFRNAGIFHKSLSCCDSITINGELVPRKTVERIEVPVGTLSKRHISNLLHVLMGQRPVPSLRKTNMKHVAEIKALADVARVKITSFQYDDSKGNPRYQSEIKSVRKVRSDCNYSTQHKITLDGIETSIGGGIFTWEKLKYYLNTDNLFEDFVSLCKELLGEDCVNDRVEDVIGKLTTLKSDKVVQFTTRCKVAKKGNLYNLLNFKNDVKMIEFIEKKFPKTNEQTIEAFIEWSGDNQITDEEFKARKKNVKGIRSVNLGTCADMRVKLLLCKSTPEKISKIDGYIVVPLSEEMIERFHDGSGTATFLEGGIAYISSIEEYSELIELDTIEPVE